MNAILKTAARPGMQPDEWAARLELATCYRIFAMLGWTEMIYNHITLRLPDSVTGGATAGASKSAQFLINPFGARKTVEDSFQWDARFGAGQDVFDALVRQVHRIDPSYKN